MLRVCTNTREQLALAARCSLGAKSSTADPAIPQQALANFVHAERANRSANLRHSYPKSLRSYIQLEERTQRARAAQDHQTGLSFPIVE